MRRFWVVAIIACVLCVMPAVAGAQKVAKWAATSIRYPGALNTVVYGVNKWVHVVGEYQAADGSWHGFIKGDNGYETVEPNGIVVKPYGINYDGAIVGQHYTDGGFGTQSFALDPAGNYSTLDYPGAQFDILMKVNNLGDVCGSFLEEGFGNSVGWVRSQGVDAAIWVPDGGDIIPQDVWCEDLDNNGGQAGNLFNIDGRMIGWTLAGGVFTFYEFPGADVTIIRGTNDHGHLVGEYHDPVANRWRGFLYKAGVWWTLDIQKDAETHPYDISNGQHIVGFYARPGDDWRLHGFRGKTKK